MINETSITDGTDIAVGVFQDLSKQVIAAQTELSRNYFDAYWHWQECLQTESTQLTELFKNVFFTYSPADQIGILQAWMKGATGRLA
ncbi:MULTISPECIES: hypothetical protein [Bradyrhizobium]|uniref:Phasin domain-containing protein n=1 Tax=Bradyrhizobium septentrionale TaxID=1404411 RepID=A0ABZ2NWA3_9BRAD